jgi:tetratricopeptide (TPR) repeat protein
MPTQANDQTGSTPHLLDEAIAAYLEAAAAGQEPDRAQWLERYPELAKELTAFFADHDRLQRIAAPLRSSTGSVSARGDTERPTLPFDPMTGADLSFTPQRFGDYDLLTEIAHGGMGIVYEARHIPLNRIVALKMILSGRLASPAEVQRFRSEATAAAELDHPHIVPIYEVGECQGQCYFTMKLIRGSSLARKPDEYMSRPREAVRLLVTIARAVHHAHQHGILHRDLKPANILLDADGQPHVTDFGLAMRFTNEADITQSGALTGTPSYMAPEQAMPQKSKLSTATDVYGLGGILYALLTGGPPFRSVTPLATVLEVVDKPPISPRSLNSRVPVDLETICLKCLEKEPSARYSSAEALADDLERFFNGEPTLARPLPAWRRTLKWARRHPWASAAVALLTINLALLGVGGWVTSASLKKQLDLEEQYGRDMKAAHDRSAEDFQAAREAVDHILSRLTQDELAHLPNIEEVRQQVLNDALGLYQRLLKQRGTDPAARYETARAARRVADIRCLLGQHDEALELYPEAVRLEEALVVEFPDEPAYRQELALSEAHFGLALRETGKLQQAEKSYRRAVELGEQLAGDSASTPTCRLELATVLDSLGTVLHDTSRPDEAEGAFARASELCESLMAGYPQEAAYRRQMATIQANLGRLLRKLGQQAPALAAFNQAVDLRRALLDKNPQLPQYRLELANNLARRGSLFWVTHRFDESERDLQEGLTLCRGLVRDFPAVPSYRAGLSHLLAQRALNENKDKNRKVTAAYFREVLGIRRWLVDMYPRVYPYRQELALVCNQLGQVLRELGERAEAEDLHREALDMCMNLVRIAPNVPDYRHGLGVAQFNLAKQRVDDGDLEAARLLADQAVVNLTGSLEPNSREPTYRHSLNLALGVLADVCFRQKDYTAVANAVTNAIERDMLADTAAVHIRCARWLTRCATMAAADTRLAPTQRSQLIGPYLEQAEIETKRAAERRARDLAVED